MIRLSDVLDRIGAQIVPIFSMYGNMNGYLLFLRFIYGVELMLVISLMTRNLSLIAVTFIGMSIISDIVFLKLIKRLK
jgi:hypothetical protein